MFRTLTPRQLAFDVILAAACLLLRLVIGIAELPMYGVVLAMAAALALRRVSPPLALAIAWLGAVIQVSTGLNPDASNIAIPAVLYATASYGSRAVRWLGLTSAGAGALVITVYLTVRSYLTIIYPQPVDLFRTGIALFVFSVVGLGLSWTLGLLARTWRTARDSRRAQWAAEAERQAAQSGIIVEQERNRIARDMHDVVAHSLAVVIAQADGARYARAQDPDAVDAALSTISSTAREALGDVRILLGQLRHSQGEVPQPMLADLDRLLDQMRASGLAISVERTGDPIALAAGEQLALYRVVQEALTNALRHGDTAEEVRVAFAWTPETVGLSVESGLLAGAPAEANSTGHGLAGMRERAALWGGTFNAGRADRHYVVTATLPVRAVTGSAS